MEFLKANEPFAVSALIIALGYLLKRLGILKVSDGEALAKVALNFTLPAVILLNVPGIPLRGANAALPLFSLGGAALTVLIGLAVFRNQERTDKGLSLVGSSGYNIGLFALPLVAGVYGTSGVARFALIDIGNVVAIFVVSYYLAYRFSPLRNAGLGGVRFVLMMFLRSIPFLSYIVAILMNLAGWEISGFGASILNVPAAMNRGVALLTLGILLRFRFPEGTWKAIFPPLAVRYAVGITGAAVVLFTFPMTLDNRLAAAGVLVMPMGLTIIPYALKWGYDRDRAAAILNTGIPISFVLFWLVWVIGRHLGA